MIRFIRRSTVRAGREGVSVATLHGGLPSSGA